ncbi:MAG: DUF2815 family protein, partial [Oscillibacter sp.]|nr:DUF2815 family protein [Oscillibacter sp.]
PSGDPKYSVTVLVPKTNTRAKAMIDQAIAAAIERGVTNPKCWNGVRPPQPAIPIHDGDGVRPSDGSEYGAECKGCWVFTASSKTAPFVVDTQVQPIINPVDVYSGMWGNVNVEFYPYNNTKKGIGCSLNGVQKVRDDEALGWSPITANEAFQPVTPDAAPAYGSPAPSAPSGGYSAQGGYIPASGQNFPQTAPAAPQQGLTTAPAPAAPQTYQQTAPQPGYGQGYTPQNPPQGYGQPTAAPRQWIDTGSGDVLNYVPPDGYGPSGYPVQPYQG